MERSTALVLGFPKGEGVRRLHTRIGIAALLIALAVLLAGSSRADAAQIVIPQGAPFGPDGTSATDFGFAVDLDVDPAEDRLYVFDRDPSPAIRAFDLPGHTLTGGAFPLSVPGTSISGIGVDRTLSPSSTAGNLYYASESAQKVFGFTSVGTELTGNFPLDPAAPKNLCDPAVDSAGNIYVADSSIGALRKYDSTGNPLGTIITTGVASPCRIAFDSNDDVFVSSYGGPVWKYTAASGYSNGTQIYSGAAYGFAVDTTKIPHRLYITHVGGVSTYQVDGTALSQFDFGGKQGQVWFRGIAIDPDTGLIYTSDSVNSQVHVFGYATVPDSTTGIADDLTGTAATLNGVVDPQGFEVTDCRFEYVTQSEFQLRGFANAESVDCTPDPGSGTGGVAVSASIAGLTPGTGYRFRLTAANANGSGPLGTDIGFTTAGPQIQGTTATQISATGATLEASVNPSGEATGYLFEYVTAAEFEQNGYANAAAIPAVPVGIGSGSAYVPVSQSLGGLALDTGYHFRVRATNPSGVSLGPDTVFSTSPLGQPVSCPNPLFHTGPAAELFNCRAYEQVSPLDKNGYDVSSYAPILARADGSRVAYSSFTGAFADPRAGAFPGAYIASRAGNWGTENVSPPVEPQSQVWSGEVIGASGDLSKQLVVSNRQLTPEAVNNRINIYVHDSADDSYELVATAPAGVTGPGLIHPASGNGNHTGFSGASFDGSRLFFSTPVRLDSVPPPPSLGGGNNTILYEFSEGQLKLVGILPDETVAETRSVAGVPPQTGGADDFQGDSVVAFHPVSEDGNRVYWTTGDPDFNAPGPLYLRENGVTTLVSERASDSSAQNATFWYGSAGGVAYFTSAGRLTPDASQVGQDLYRYDPDTGELANLTADGADAGGADVQNVLGVSRDGTFVYFIANGVLAPGATPGECPGLNDQQKDGQKCSLYVWHNGETRLIGGIGSLSRQFLGPYPGVVLTNVPFRTDWRVSANGRYLGFLFGGEITGPNPQDATGVTNPITGWDFKRAYLYDYQAGTLECASCPPGGAAHVGDPQLGLPPSNFSNKVFATSQIGLTRNVSNAGQFFFATTDALVARDTNEKQDVYEFDNGQIGLISGGRDLNDSYFGDASASGDDVFFLTREGLVGQDIDANYDLYDARAGGGIADQLTAAVGAVCQGDACQGAFTSPPAGPGPGTSVFSGPGDPTPKHKRPKHKKHRKHKKHHKHHHHRADHRGGAGK